MDYRILGPLELAHGRAVGKQGALAGLLLLHANRTLGAERLIEALWGDDRPRSAANLLQGYVSQLRKLLGPERITTVPGGYQASAAADQLDSLRFVRLVDEGREAADPARMSALLAEALGLWRGKLLEGLPLDISVEPEARRLEELRQEALELRLAADLDLGRSVVVELEVLVAAEPLRERPRELLMLALYRSGRQAEALGQYRRARRALVDELGIEPGQTLKDLEQSILRQDPSLDVHKPEPAGLVVPPSPLIGRERELEHALDVLRRPDVRLLTLTGTGGIGKTRLALELARLLHGELTDGAMVVPLASVADPALVASTIAQALGVSPSELHSYLGPRSLLLVLDNLEHLLPAAPVLTDLLAAAPGLRLLVTSTAVLHLYDEHVLEVPTLDVPERGGEVDLGDVPSVALFVRRARAANDRFALDRSSGPPVAEICRRLDGLPLAIELAAARTKLLPPRALLERLGDRLDVLGGGSRDAPPRQRTLRATLDWSHGILDPGEQRLFARLGVFAGGCTLEAAEAVCGDGGPLLDVLASLVDKSLLRPVGDEPRFAMLETQREYAVERLEQSREADLIRSRHLEYFTGLAERAEPELRGERQLQWHARLEADNDNFRAALAHAIAGGRSALALRLAIALTRFWHVRGHTPEGRRWLLDALALGGDVPAPLRARALNRAGALSLRLGLHGEARPLLDESIELYRRANDEEGVVSAMMMSAHACLSEGDPESALVLLNEAAAAYEALGNRHGFATALGNAGVARLMSGDFAGAAAVFEASAALSVELGDRQALAVDLLNIGWALLGVGDVPGAVARLEESVEVARELDFRDALAQALMGFAMAAEQQGEPRRAARLLGAGEALRESLGIALEPYDAGVHDRLVTAVGEAVGEATLTAAWAEGRSLELDDAIEFALRPAERW
jgi:predicted ATPase/DNA-binding SARP family transcriptional activator